MRVVYSRQWQDSAFGSEPQEVTCRSAFVRDGVLIMVDTVDGETRERGIPVVRLAEYEIYKDDRAEPRPEFGSGITSAWMDRKGAATDWVTKTVSARPFQQVVAPGMLDSTVGEPDGNPFTELENMLNGWIADTRSNHDSLEHRDEESGRECWTRLTVDDVQGLIAAARREWKPGA